VILAITQGFQVRVASIYVQEYVLNREITVKKTKEGGINELKKISTTLCIGQLCQNEAA